MLRTLAIFAVSLIAFGSASDVHSADGNGLLISQTEARRYGLERMWFTQVRLDPARARLTDLTYFVSATQSYTVFEVHYGDRKRTFSERDTDRFGDLIGKEGAEKAAKAFIEELKLHEIEGAVKTISVPEITIYAVSDRAVLHAIDAETGRTRWATVVGNRDYPVERPGVNEDYVATLNGSTLHLLKRATGETAWIRTVESVVSAGPALTNDHVIVPTFSGNVESYDIDETRTLPDIYRSNGRVLVQPVAMPASIVWPTDRGFLYVARIGKKSLRYRMECKQPIVSQPAYASPKKILATAVDGYVYCLNEQSGQELWRFPSGEPISSSPVPVADVVYVVTDRGSLFCLGLEDGLEKWSSPQVQRVLSVTKNHLYCLTVTGRISVMDAKTGGQIAVMGDNSLDVFYSNALTDRIIIGSTTGVLQCLRETELEWPLLHINLAEAEQARRPEIKQGSSEPAPKEKPAAGAPAPAAADPFGAPAPGDADPFGAPAPAPEAAKPAAAKSDDPFG